MKHSDPATFSGGTLADATAGDLMLPLGKRGGAFLIARGGAGEMLAVALDAEHEFMFFPSDKGEHWAGMLAQDVRIVVDAKSAFSPEEDGEVAGSLVRYAGKLAIVARPERGSPIGRQAKRLTLRDELRSSPKAVAFAKWAVVIGNDDEPHELFKVDVG